MPVLSLSQILAHWADIQPERVAIDHEGQQISWEHLEGRTSRLARAYADLGVRENDFVTIALPNSLEFFEAVFAAWKLGATPQPVSARLPKYERDQIVALAKPALVVGVEADEYAPIPSIPAGFTPHAALPDTPLPEKTARSFKAMTSGGSTGQPKLIVSKLPAEWDTNMEFLQIRNQGSMLIPGPLYHNGPFMWAVIALFKGATVAVTTRFDAEKTLELIDRMKIETAYMVPTMMRRIWALPEEVRARYDVSSLTALWHLAAPCPPWLKEAFIEWLGPEVIWELYGGTEGQGSTTIQGTEWLTHRGSVGKPVETCEIKIFSEDGAELPPGEVGEVFLRPLAGQGSSYYYLGAEAKAIEGGWESLGDMGWMDEEGYLYLTDRRSDMIVVGGANIYPAEIEAALDAFPGVRSSAVIGLPDEDMGARLHAIVDMPDRDLDEAALMAHLKERLVTYKLPKSIELVREPLRDDAGKTRRKALREARL
ncbi:MAG: acid--CoA ligase [Henriciella sp.]|jgi:bile acid-coenzyme A ligase|uniref:AMP-binding protein n=1 Tax=Henriciella sp. TaxID=1968823 RepID=UPI000C0E54AB|nr:AMP-binding protein [Henriciella sp.]MAN73700.1 acid--CoA ligase [Henriciella sp.]MBF35075.1 acid--CoA ligase [Hyphomonadaceae bacterium]PHR74920.1 MAG: acid--CoA ligase [Henriciella sp.]|tara:strand:- start:3841 stop:5289 length:1449 start_codon:yes stop_codon:yes gene_type:complete